MPTASGTPAYDAKNYTRRRVCGIVDIEAPDAQFPGLIFARTICALFTPDRLRILLEEIRTAIRSQYIYSGPFFPCYSQPKICRTVIAHNAMDRNFVLLLL